MNLDNITLFLMIVEKGSLTAAGREMGLSPTTVSERLAALEAHFGVVLLNRTTRSISLTEEGRTLFDGARDVLDSAEDLETRIRYGAKTITGAIRVSVPRDLGHSIVSDAIKEFLSTHPAISVDLELSDGFIDIVGRGIDIAVRYGRVPDSTLRSRKLGDCRRLICASPRYIERYGAPKEPADLKRHNCLVMRFGQDLDNQWDFGDGAGGQAITVNGDRIANDSGLVRKWCVSGDGIARKTALDIYEDLRTGQLVELLKNYAVSPLPLQLIFPPSRAQPRRVQVLADHLQKTIQELAAQNTVLVE